MEVVAPFVAVVRSEETSGLITALALGSLHKLVSNGLCGSCLAYVHRLGDY